MLLSGGIRSRWSVIAVEELQVWRRQTGGRCVNQPRKKKRLGRRTCGVTTTKILLALKESKQIITNNTNERMI